MKMKICATGFFLILTFGGSQVQAAPKCSATKLSDDDARILIYVSPRAEAARNQGAKVDIKDTEPSKKYPASDYFVGVIVRHKFFGDDMLGHFVVNKQTGTIKALGKSAEVKGVELKRIQSLMRLEHCIHVRRK